jgi:serine protease Do
MAESDGEIPQQKNSAAVRAVFRDSVKPVRECVVRVLSNEKQLALGTVVDADGYILTKASELRGKLTCELSGGRRIDAEVVGVADDHDLALLHVDTKGLTPVTWESDAPSVGTWVASASWREDPVSVGVISVIPRKIAPQAGFLGIVFADKEEAAKINEVIPGSGAEKAGMKVGDLILKVNGKEISNRVALTDTIRKYKPGETVELKIKRGDKEMDVEARIGVRPDGPIADKKDIQNSMGGPLSERRVGFASVLQHDTVLKPTDVGGPLVDLDGKVVGVNIARGGRVMSYAVPSAVVQSLLSDLRSGKYPVPESLVAARTQPGPSPAEAKITEITEALKKAEAAKASAEINAIQAADALKKAAEAKATAEEMLKKAQADMDRAIARQAEANSAVEALKSELEKAKKNK